MDVERIQKVNNLALDLLKQGLAKDREDAINQAQRIFNGKDSEEYNQMKDTLNDVKREANKGFGNHSAEEKDLSSEKVKDILEQNTKFLVKTIKEFQEKINGLEKEINSMRSKFDYHKIPSAGEILTTEEAVNVARTETPPRLGEVTDNNVHVPKNHPKFGDFAKNEVSIEKFFYMGK